MLRRLSKPMRRHELFDLIDAGEGIDIEFKRHFSSSEKIAKELIALANTVGGFILFGVDDDGSIVGVRSEKSELDEIQHAATFFCEPPIKLSVEYVNAGGGKDIVVVRVEESVVKPHYLVDFDSSGRKAKSQTRTSFVRVGESSVQASKEVKKVMQSEHPDAPPLRLSIGHNERALFEYLEAHGRVTVGEFADLVNISGRRASKILVSLVRSGTLRIHTLEKTEYFTLSS